MCRRPSFRVQDLNGRLGARDDERLMGGSTGRHNARTDRRNVWAHTGAPRHARLN